MPNGVHLPRIAKSLRDQLAATLFGNRDIVLLEGLVIYVGEVHIVELHAAQLL